VSLAATRPAPRTAAEVASAQKSTERWTRRGVVLVFWLLLANVLTFYPKTWSGQPLILPIPSPLGKAWTQGALPLALVLALVVNRRRFVRPNVFLCLVSLLVVGAAIGMLQAEHFGTIYRTCRLAGFIGTLWLLTPWFGRRDLLLVRAYLGAMSVVLTSVLLGLVVAPSRARGGGRLAGALWPTPPTQVAEFAAVTMGLVIIMWLCGLVRGRIALVVVVPAAFILLETHTRTALLAIVTALFVAGLSLITARARVRKAFAAAAIVASVVAITLSGFITSWLTRGQDAQQLTDLTGRTNVWNQVFSITRNLYQVVFGFGLSNKSFNGLPIDSNWLASYYDQGLWGVVVCAVILIFLLVALLFQPRGPMRALGLFLVVYCLVASFTETGFSDASTYLLELTLAASLLLPAAARSAMDRRLE
jgi:hypothetical protein